jgi:hypothetical protein
MRASLASGQGTLKEYSPRSLGGHIPTIPASSTGRCDTICKILFSLWLLIMTHRRRVRLLFIVRARQLLGMRCVPLATGILIPSDKRGLSGGFGFAPVKCVKLGKGRIGGSGPCGVR